MLDKEVGDFTRIVSAFILKPDNALNPEFVHLLLEPQAEVEVVNALAWPPGRLRSPSFQPLRSG